MVLLMLQREDLELVSILEIERSSELELGVQTLIMNLQIGESVQCR